MAASSGLLRLGFVILCVERQLELGNSFTISFPLSGNVVSSSAVLTSTTSATCRALSNRPPRCRRRGALTFPRQDSSLQRPVCRSSSEMETAQDGTVSEGHQEEKQKELHRKGVDAAVGIAKPAWVEDPDEGRVRTWIRLAGRKREHDRVAMYLRKYREGKARKGELASIEIYNTALHALDHCHKWRLALSVFRQMQEDGVAADRNSYFFVISACSRRGEAHTAQNLLKEMTKGDGPAPDLLLYAVTVKACAGGKSWRRALVLLEEMSAAGVKPNVVVLNTVISACAKCGQIDQATELLRDMQKKYDVSPDAVSYNTVISGYERAGDWREALDLARTMDRLEGIAPTVVTYNSVIGACKRAGRPKEALAVLGLLRRKGLQPDVISFNSAISACASGGKWETAFRLLELMPSEGVTPDLTTYNTAMDACVKSGQWEIAMSLFDELAASQDAALLPDLYTYNTLMAVFSHSGMLERGLELLEGLKRRGLRPDVVTYSTLIRACERASPSQPKVALKLVSDMETAGVRPNNTTFVSVALSLGRAGEPMESLGVLDSMKQRGTPPDAICCQTVLRVLDRWDHADEAFGLFEEMREKGMGSAPEVAEEMYCCGIRALEKLGRWSEAVRLLDEWRNIDGYESEKEDGYEQWYLALGLLATGGLPEGTDAKTARAAMVAAARGGLAEEALAIMRNMEAMGFELGVVEYGAVIEAFEQSGKPEKGLEIFDDMAACGVEPDVLCYAAATRCSCRRGGDWETALSLLEATLRQGLLPTGRTLQTVAGLCRNAGKYEQLWDLKELMRQMIKDGGMARPGSPIYISLIRACGEAERPDLVLRCLAEMFIDEAPGKDWRIAALDEPTTVSAAVGALSACNEIVEADRTYADAIRRQILPDPADGKSWTAASSRAAAAVTANPAVGVIPPLIIHGSGIREGFGGGNGAGKGEYSGAASGTAPNLPEAESRYRDRGSGNVESGGDHGVNRVSTDSPASSQQRRESSSHRSDSRGSIGGNSSSDSDGGVASTRWDTGAEGGGQAVVPAGEGVTKPTDTKSEGRRATARGDPLWVDLRRTPVELIPTAMRRVVQALKAVGSVSDGLVVQWGGARDDSGEDGNDSEGAATNGGGAFGARRGGSDATRVGRRGAVIDAFSRVEPALMTTEPPKNRGQVRVQGQELHRWLREAKSQQR